MKNIRNQLKYPVELRLTVFPEMGSKNKNCWYSIFIWLQKEPQIDNKEKSVKFCQKRLWNCKAYTLALKLYSIAPSPNTNNLFWDLSIMKPSKK